MFVQLLLPHSPSEKQRKACICSRFRQLCDRAFCMRSQLRPVADKMANDVRSCFEYPSPVSAPVTLLPRRLHRSSEFVHVKVPLSTRAENVLYLYRSPLASLLNLGQTQLSPV